MTHSLSPQAKALLWAALILTSAFIMSAVDMDSSASFGVIAGLTGAAWASLQSEAGCSRGCLQ